MKSTSQNLGGQTGLAGTTGSLPFYIRLAHVLVKHGVIDAGAVEDPEGWDRSQTLQCVAMAAAEIEAENEDKTRLDWLETCRAALNAHCGSSYGWEVVRSHLVNRVMLETPEVCAMAAVDVNDTGPRGKSLRDAIDAAMREANIKVRDAR